MESEAVCKMLRDDQHGKLDEKQRVCFLSNEIELFVCD